MWVETLKIHNCRILREVDIEFSPSLNIINGQNGSGKTSLLEALTLLSKGRSFRTSRIAEVINYDKSSVLIASTIQSNSGIITKIGIEKLVGKTHIRINQKDIHSQSELSRFLPITVIHPDSIKLITGSPSERRAYIDWLCFYSFPSFYENWKSYQHILKQRNSCLKNKAHRYALSTWTDKLIDLQPVIHDFRSKALDKLKPQMIDIASELLGDVSCDIELKSGVPLNVEFDKQGLSDFYAEKVETDIKFGRTNSGVHRADLNISLNGIPAVQSASRGQLKLLSISLLLAQSNAINSKGDKGIIIIDDVAAELDEANKNNLLNYLQELNQQLILTNTD
ncbi:DNA replication and repair protein RecF [Nymphon striatum]|nr:DNA replication and repair protein RecF [Nymphon striatum]